MVIDKFAAIKTAGKLGTNSVDNNAFKAVMDQKRNAVDKISQGTSTPLIAKAVETNLKTMVNDVVKNHEAAAQTIKSFMARTDYSPERLLAIQYRTGVLFLREQMYCKTAELSATTFKNFTQMQV
jgi:hypothetical protein